MPLFKQLDSLGVVVSSKEVISEFEALKLYLNANIMSDLWGTNRVEVERYLTLDYSEKEFSQYPVITKASIRFVLSQIESILLGKIKEHVSENNGIGSNRWGAFIFSKNSKFNTIDSVEFYVGLSANDTSIRKKAVFGDYIFENGEPKWQSIDDTAYQPFNQNYLIYKTKFDRPGNHEIRGIYYLPVNGRIELELPISGSFYVE